MLIKKAADVEHINQGYVWESKIMRASFWKTLIFALITGDWNKIHVNPFTLFQFKSHLGGMTCPGDLVLSLTKAGIHRVIQFEEPTEIIAFGYESVEFKRPLRIGTKFFYRLTLLNKSSPKGNIRCLWLVEVIDTKNKVLCSEKWTMGYFPVDKSKAGYAVDEGVLIGQITFVILILLSITFMMVHYVPLNEYCYPCAP